jgi:hypothetical protein
MIILPLNVPVAAQENFSGKYRALLARLCFPLT